MSHSSSLSSFIANIINPATIIDMKNPTKVLPNPAHRIDAQNINPYAKNLYVKEDTHTLKRALYTRFPQVSSSQGQCIWGRIEYGS